MENVHRILENEKKTFYLTGEAMTPERKMVCIFREKWHRRYVMLIFDSANRPRFGSVEPIWEAKLVKLLRCNVYISMLLISDVY